MDVPLRDFLQQTPPFDLLSESRREELEQVLERKVYEAETQLYQQDYSSLEELSLIAEGSVVKYFQGQGNARSHEETFGPGDTFGAISILLNNHRAIRSVRTLTATVIYQMPASHFLALCKENEAFADFFTHEFGRRMLSSGYAEYLLRNARPVTFFDVSDHAFQRTVNDFLSSSLNTCPADTPIQEAAKIMSYFRRGYVVVTDEQGQPVGILTDLDLRIKVVAGGRDIQQPVRTVMSSPLISLPRNALAYEAILLMFRKKVNHLLVTDEEGKVVGMVLLDKLLNAQAKSPFIFISGINYDSRTEELYLRWAQMPKIIESLVDRGVRAEIVNQIVTAVSDAITANIIRRALRELGPPPCNFVFMALGSEGRKEQTLATDQDNALIYADVPGMRREVVREYFLRLGERVCDELNEVGFAYCEGNLMAKNPKWNHSLSHWKKNYHKWITQPFGDHLHISVTFFDSRPIFGDAFLLEDLRKYIFAQLQETSSLFFAQLTRTSLAVKPPLTFFNNFQLESVDENRKALNIKKAMLPVIDFARIYALKHQISEQNTGERLKQLWEKGVLLEKEYQELHQAYYFMMRMRLTHQSQQLSDGQPADNLLNPKSLSQIETVTLKEVFRLVEKHQKTLAFTFTGSLNA